MTSRFRFAYLLIALAACDCRGRTEPKTGAVVTVPPAAETARAPEPSPTDAPIDAGVERGLTPSSLAMDAAFRADLAELVVAQVAAERWEAFLPKTGVTSRRDACISLMDGSVTDPSWTRACTAQELEKDHRRLLEQIADDLTAPKREANDGKFICTKATCSLHVGEHGFNGDVVFARVGVRAELVTVTEPCGGAVDAAAQRELARANQKARAPARCRGAR